MMFTFDMPNFPLESSLVLAEMRHEPKSNNTQIKTIGVCHVVPNLQDISIAQAGAEYSIEPTTEARLYFGLYENKKLATASILAVLQKPVNGELRVEGSNFVYLPHPGFIGSDSADILIDAEGNKVKVKYFFQALNHALGNKGAYEACKKTGYRWKISVGPGSKEARLRYG